MNIASEHIDFAASATAGAPIMGIASADLAEEAIYGDKKILRLMVSYLFVGTAVPTAAGLLYIAWAYSGAA